MNETELPNTDSPDVMRQAITMQLTSIIWEQYSRLVPDDEFEERLLAVHDRVYKAVRTTHDKG